MTYGYPPDSWFRCPHLGRFFDFEKLHEVASAVTRNLNKIIDVNYYPVDTAERSNKRHRPIGLGVQVGGRWWSLESYYAGTVDAH